MSDRVRAVRSARARLFGLVVCGLAAGAAWLALAAGPALALVVHPYVCQITGTSPGSATECNSGGSAAPGGLLDTSGVAISGSDLWVSSPPLSTIDRFGLGGAFVSQIPKTGTGYSLTTEAAGVARDDSSGQLYVADSFAGDVDVFDSTNVFVNAWTGSTTPSGSFDSIGGAIGVAVDNSSGASSGDVYVLDSTHEVIDRLDSSGNPVSFSGSGSYISGSQLTGTPNGAFKFNSNSESALAVDSDGNLYVADAGNEVVDEFSSDGTFVQSFDGAGTPAGKFGSLVGIGVDASGDVYVVDQTNHVVDELSPTGTYLSEITGSVTPAGASSFAPKGVAADPSSGNVYVTTGGLIDEFSGSTVTIPDEVTGSASTIQATSATLNATLNPDGTTLTDCHFDYGPSAADGQSVPCASTPSGSSPVAVRARIAGLIPATTYRFRLDAANSTAANPGALVTFTTPPAPTTANLTATSADLNAQINPGGEDTSYHFEWGTSTDYGNTVPTADADVGSGTAAVTATQHITGLTAGTLYHWRVVATSAAGTVTGPDQTFIYEPAAPSGAGCANAQLRTGSAATLPDCRAYEQVSPADKNGQDVAMPAQAVATDGSAVSYNAGGAFAGTQSNNGIDNWYVSRRDALSWSTAGIAPPTYNARAATFIALYVGASPDLRHMVVENQTEDLPQSLYLRDPDGSETLINPGGPTVTNQGGISGSLYEGASPDFTHILFAPSQGSSTTEEWVNGTVTQASPTVVQSQCTTGNTGQSGPGGNCSTASVSLAPTQFVDSDGYLTSIAVFTSNTELTNDAGPGINLYRYDADTGKLTDLASDPTPADMLSIVGASSDGSYVYFVSGGALAPGASANTCSTFAGSVCNLYVSHNGKVTFITELSGVDYGDWDAENYVRITRAQVSGDGAHLLFTSTSSLTGYDNAGFSELYRYDAGSDALTCVSCDPSGAAATGNAELSKDQLDFSFPEQANITADGSRVFFQSSDALVPADTNGASGCQPDATVAEVPACQDVYEWEADGTGGCHSASQDGGCVYLIPVGDSKSSFMGASANGDDLFLATRAGLVRQDSDGDMDVYDARVGGGIAGQQAAPSGPASCSGSACQGAAAPAPPPPTAGSVTFAGSGNQPPSTPPPAGTGGTPPASVPPTVTSKVKVTKKVVTGTRFRLSVKVPAKGQITIAGAGVKEVRKSVARAGTYKLTVALTAKAKRRLMHRRRLKLVLRVGYVPVGGKPSHAIVRMTVTAGRQPTKKAHRSSRGHGGAR